MWHRDSSSDASACLAVASLRSRGFLQQVRVCEHGRATPGAWVCLLALEALTGNCAGMQRALVYGSAMLLVPWHGTLRVADVSCHVICSIAAANANAVGADSGVLGGRGKRCSWSDCHVLLTYGDLAAVCMWSSLICQHVSLPLLR